jgi:hypothetical protein
MLRVSNCVANRVPPAIRKPTEWQRIGNKINAAFILARGGVRKDLEWLMRTAPTESASL